MVKLVKSLADYFPLILDWLNVHRAWGYFIVLLCFLALAASGYAYVQSTENETSLYKLNNRLDRQKEASMEWRNCVQGQFDVVNAKLDILVNFVNKGD